MPELRDETTDDGFHEIQFTGKQLVFLFMATTVVLIFTFLAGVLVGRDLAVKRGDELIAGPAAPPTPTQTAETGPPAVEPPTPPAEDELSYHNRLQSNAASEEKPQPKPPEPKPEPPAAAPAPPPSTPAEASVPATGRPGTWVIQVIALKDRAAAAALVRRLAAKGYPAFLESPASGLYRVRVGRFNDRREAEQVRRRLEKEEQFKSAISR